ncbi:unnamed protein product [Chrysoparadoxa australica]
MNLVPRALLCLLLANGTLSLSLRSFIRDSFNIIQEVGVAAPIRRSSNAVSAGLATSLEAVNQQLREGETPPNPVLLRQLMMKLGSTYIKLGQFIASSPTIFPPEYVTAFASCLDDTPTTPWNEMKGIIETGLGRRLTDVYSWINTVPLASASIAQCYEARLKTGEDVVIKVQKPEVSATLKTDLGFLYVSSRLVELINPEFDKRLSMSQVVGDIRESMIKELDFNLEARNLEEFSAFVEREDLGHQVTAPSVYWEQTCPTVLTMERLYGVPLTDLEAIKGYTNDPEGVLVSAINTWTLSIMKCSFFHADVHAGNLMVLRDGRVGFLDFGIVGTFKPDTWGAMSSMADALAVEDFRGVAKSLVQMGATLGPVNEIKFAEDLARLFAKYKASAAEDGEGDDEMSSVMFQANALCRDNNLKLPREMGLLLKQQLYFDRYTRLLAPKTDPLKESRIKLQNEAASQRERGPATSSSYAGAGG